MASADSTALEETQSEVFESPGAGEPATDTHSHIRTEGGFRGLPSLGFADVQKSEVTQGHGVPPVQQASAAGFSS